MPQVLYRKYRSKDFSELFGQEAVKQVLRQAVLDKSVAHAYLFTGPRGTGKTSTARILAKALNCLSPKNGEPCNECKACKSINEGSFLDLIEIDAASNRGIDEIRELKERVGFLPAEGDFKVYIIDEVHMLTTEAFNALLKTLEEPPERVVFILATTEAHKLPLTIISRTQRYDFKLGSREDLKSKLETILGGEGIKFDADALELVVDAGRGSFRDAETILEKVLSSYGYLKDREINKTDVENVLGYASSEIVTELYDALLSQDRKAALGSIGKAEESGVNMQQLITQLLEFARKHMTAMVSGDKSPQEMGAVTQIIKHLMQASADMRTALIPVLPLEVAAVHLTGDDTAPTQVRHVAPKPVAKVQPQPETKPVKEEKPKTQKPVKQQDEEDEEEEQTAEAAEEKVEVPVATGSGDEPALDDVKGVWSQVLAGCKKVNPQMVAMLTKAQVDSVSDGAVALRVPYKFHKSRLEQKRSQEIFAAVLQELTGTPLRIQCSLDESIKEQKEKSSSESSNSDIVEEVFSDMI